MPLPHIHQKTLERQLQVHERRLELLRKQWDALGNPAAHPDPNPKPRTPQSIEHQRAVVEREIQIHEWETFRFEQPTTWPLAEGRPLAAGRPTTSNQCIVPIERR